jgi:hypothetical protein
VGLVSQTGLGSLILNRGGGSGGILQRRGGATELQVADADLIEHWQSAKVLWVVIMNSEIGVFILFSWNTIDRLSGCFTDQEIEGIELAESQEDEERVDERTWQAEMNVEREDLEFDAEVERIAAAQNQEASQAPKS